MEFEDIWGYVLLGGIMFLFMPLQIFLRTRKRERTEPEIAFSLLGEIERNLKLIEGFTYELSVQRFKTGSWERNKAKLDFLDQKLRAALSGGFTMAEDFNQRIDTAKKRKSTSYLAGIQVDRLREPLAKSKEGLVKWLEETMERQEALPKRRGLFG